MKGCRSCSCWQAMEEFLDRIDPATQGKKAQLGLCRRSAPRPLTAEAGAGARGGPEGGELGGESGGELGGAARRWNTFWPQVASDDWCGEWDPQFD